MKHLKANPTAWALAALFALVLGASVNLDGPSDHETNLMVAAAVADVEAGK